MRIAAVLGVLALGIGVAQADIPKGAPPVIIPPPPVPMPLPPKPAPPLPPTPKVRAKPVESPGSWINPDDYPPVALRFDMTGISAFRLFIDAEGKPSHCQITAGSGFQILDDAACERLMEHGKFSPAQDAKGRAVADVWNSRVVWRLPFADPQPLREGNGVATLMISKMGIVTHCAVKVDVPDHETSQNMCWDTDSIPRLAALEMRGYGEAPMTEVEMEWSSALSSAARDRFEAFATVREASKRVLGMRHFDVQLIGGMVLHAARSPKCAPARARPWSPRFAGLSQRAGRQGRPRRHRQRLPRPPRRRMDGPGLSLPRPDHVGVIVPTASTTPSAARLRLRHHLRHQQRIRLRLSARQHEVLERAQMVQRGHQLRHRRRGRLDPDRRGAHAADHLRPDRRPSELYKPIDALMKQLKEALRARREAAQRSPDRGRQRAHRARCWRGGLLQGLASTTREHAARPPRQPGAARHKLFSATRLHRQGRRGRHHRRVHRPHDGRAAAVEGLHQALEAKEGVKIQPENQTLASITFQNYFRLYDKLAGMTGTAATEAEEFADIYKLDVVEIPTNRAGAAHRRTRRVYRTAAEKYAAIAKRSGATPRASRCWSARVDREIGNALQPADCKEGHPAQRAERALPRAGSQIVAEAGKCRRRHHRHQHGRPRHRHPARRQPRHAHRGELKEKAGRAGARRRHRAFRIKAEIAAEKAQALAAGGLYVLGTERHESRRIDNQLRGRGPSGRPRPLPTCATRR
jgi:hypothetical protein